MARQRPQTWTIDVDDSRDRIVAAFHGHLDADEGVRSADAFVRALTVKPQHVVFDIREMAGYDTEARVAWQSAIWPHRKRIKSLSVLGGNPVVRMGASMLALALGLRPRYTAELEGVK